MIDPNRRAQGVTAVLVVIALGLLVSLGAPGGWPAQIWTPLWRSAWQAALSASASCVVGLSMAYAAYHCSPSLRPAWWRGLLNTTPIMPTLVVVLMLISAYGRSGIVSGGAGLYGLGGIVLAHCFINAPWVSQQVLSQFAGITQQQHRMADQLGVKGFHRFGLVFWPVIAETVRRQWALVFLLSFTSFAVVLVLAGSPKWATLEVRLYQLITLEFDLAGAVSLAWLQLLALLPLMLLMHRHLNSTISLGQAYQARPTLWGSLLWLVLSALWALPMLALALRAVQLDWPALLAQPIVWQAAWTSAWVAALSASSAVILAWFLARGAQSWVGGISGMLYFLIPSQVMALGLFLAFRAWGWGHPALAVGLSNTLMCLPFMLSVLVPALKRYPQARLIHQLGLNATARMRWIYWPRFASQLTWCWIFAFGLSLGDFGVVALFGSQDFTTLPHLLYQKLGSYRTGDAYGIAVMMWAALAALFILATPRSAHVTR